MKTFAKILMMFSAASSLFAYSPAITSFNTGQVSPYMEQRSEFPKYPSFCRTLENMLILAQGPVMRRPGTKYIATAKSANCVLVPFEYSADDTYIIEFGNLYARFYREGGQILTGAGAVYEIITEFETAELDDLRYAQSNNIMYLVDGNDPPQKLTRLAHASWTIEDANIITGPFRIENIEDINITPSAATGDISLAADSCSVDANIFDSGHVGSIWRISQKMGTSVLTGPLSADGNSDVTAFFTGNYSFTTSGTWNGTITLERSVTGSAPWSNALASLNSTNFDNPAETEADGAYYRVEMSDYVSGTCTYTLTISDAINHGIVKITYINSGKGCQATVLTDLVDTTVTQQWSEGYWSDYRGWPKAVVFHKQRLVFAGSEAFPQTIWFGKQNPDDYTNFTEGTLDTSAFTVSLEGQNPIQWLLSGDYLFIGTSGSTGKYGEQGGVITPTSPSYSEQSKIGSGNINATFANDSILYVERGNRKIREFAYSLQYDKFLAPDLTILSENITQDGIKDIAFQSRPIPILWCVLNDGNMATLTFQKDHEVVSWSLQTTDGDFESVAVIPTSDGEDEVWVEVSRAINNAMVYYIEQFQPVDWGADNNDCFFVDSGLSYNSTATTSFGGLSHLKGKSVSVYADSIALPNVTVSSAGAATIANSSAQVIIGLPFTSKLETVPITVDPQDKALNKKISSLDIDFYETGYCKYGFGKNSTLIPINFYGGGSFVTAKQPLYTSEDAPYNLKFPYGSKKKATIYLETDKPQPLTVRSIVPNFEVSQ